MKKNSDEDDTFVEIQLSLMRKLFAAVTFIQFEFTEKEKQSSLVQQVKNQNSNLEELKFIRE